MSIGALELILPVGGVLEKVLISVAAALTLALLGLLFKSVREALFYKSEEYELSYTKNTGSPVWDIQWEAYRLTISADDVSNDHLDGVVFERNRRRLADKGMEELTPSDKFRVIGSETQVKLKSIVRREVGSTSDYDYKLHFVFRRRRSRRFHVP